MKKTKKSVSYRQELVIAKRNWDRFNLSVLEAHRVHAKSRALERYKVNLNRESYERLVKKIRDNDDNVVFVVSSLNGVHHVYLLGDELGKFLVIYNRDHNLISTFLPKNLISLVLSHWGEERYLRGLLFRSKTAKKKYFIIEAKRKRISDQQKNPPTKTDRSVAHALSEAKKNYDIDLGDRGFSKLCSTIFRSNGNTCAKFLVSLGCSLSVYLLTTKEFGEMLVVYDKSLTKIVSFLPVSLLKSVKRVLDDKEKLLGVLNVESVKKIDPFVFSSLELTDEEIVSF